MSSPSTKERPKTSRHSTRNPKKERKPSKGSSHKGESSKQARQAEVVKPSTAPAETESKIPSGKEISIRVIDDCKKITETFTCEHDVLIKKMPYFKDSLGIDNEGELMITIHCDVAVFKIIMEYISADSSQETKKFKFDPKYAIHLLVSADYLHMSSLVEECLTYCHRHMNSIIESNCPVAALNESLLSRLASRFTPREIEAIKDPGGKIREKFYKILLELFLKPDSELPAKSSSQKLFKCSICEQVFATKLQHVVSCKNKKAVIGPRGELMYTHKRDINWNIEKYTEDSFQQLKSWRNVYWKTWGLVNVLHCTTCMLDFSCSDFTRCRYHKEQIVFPPTQPSQNVHEMGTFSCCGAKSFKFDPLSPLQLSTGCAYRNHTVSSAVRASDVFQDMLTYSDLMCATDTEQAPPSENQGLNRIVTCFSERAVAQWSHATSLDFLIKTGSKQSISSEGSGSVTTKSSESLTVGLPRKEPKQTGVFLSVLSAVGQSYGASEVKQVWKPGGSLWHNQDAVREHDSRQMDLMMLQFQKVHGVHRLRGSSPRKP